MARSSNLTRHGDEIVEKIVDATGRSRLVAKRQFQQFLDEVGGIVNDANNQTVDLSDLLQLATSDSARIDSDLSSLSKKVLSLLSTVQEIYVNSADLSIVKAENIALRKELASTLQILSVNDSTLAANGMKISLLNKSDKSNKQLISQQNAQIDTLNAIYSKMNKRITNLEQLIHVD